MVPTQPARPRERLADQLPPLRVQPATRRALEEQARTAGRTLSAYLRGVLVRQAAIAPPSRTDA